MSVAEAVLLGIAVSLIVTVAAGFPFVNVFRKLTFGKTNYTKIRAVETCAQGPANYAGLLTFLAVIFSAAVVFFTDLFKSGSLFSSGSLVDGEMYSLTINGLIFSLEVYIVGAVNEYVTRYKALTIDYRYNFVVFFIISLVYIFSLYMGLKGNLYIYIPYVGALTGGIGFWIISILIILLSIGCSAVQSDSDDKIALLNWIICFLFLGGIAYLRRSYGIVVICASAVASCAADYIWIKKPEKLQFGLSGNLVFCGIALAAAFAIKMPYAVITCGFGMIVNMAYKLYKYRKAKSGSSGLNTVHSLYSEIRFNDTSSAMPYFVCAVVGVTGGAFTVGLTFSGM